MMKGKNIYTNMDTYKEEKKAELTRLEKEQEYFNSLPENYRLAEIFHEMHCHYNHTDECAWYYENWNDNPLRYEHTNYLKKANRFIAVAGKNGIDTAKLLDIFSEIRPLKYPF
jgi:hypothetical protein